MKITQKARVALGEHQIKSLGTGVAGTKSWGVVNCSCGWHGDFDYADLPDDEHNTEPYLYGLMAGHQIEEMENV